MNKKLEKPTPIHDHAASRLVKTIEVQNYITNPKMLKSKQHAKPQQQVNTFTFAVHFCQYDFVRICRENRKAKV